MKTWKTVPFLLCALLLLTVFLLLPATSLAAVPGYTQIDTVSFEIEIPYGYREALFEGESPYGTSYGVYTDCTGITDNVPYYNGISWYDETGKQFLEPGDTFKPDRVYTLRVLFHITSGNTIFAEENLGGVGVTQDVTPYLNGTAVDCYLPAELNRYLYTGLVCTFDPCPESPDEIRSVNILGIASPFDCDAPNYSAVAQGPNYSVAVDEYCQPFSYNNGVCWTQALNGGYTYELQYGEDYFTRQKVYTVRILIKAEYPYRFQLNYDETMPDITAKVKGYRAEVEKANGFDPYYYCIVKLTFPACPYGLTRLDVADIQNVTAPRTGAVPDYDVTCGNEFAVLDDEGTVIKNGICWYDYTAGNFLKPTDTFLEGHVYSVSMMLEAQDGYQFRDDENGNCLTKGSVNGTAAQSLCIMGSTPNRLTFEYKFPPAETPEPLKITSQPEDAVASKGATAKVSLTATGDGLTYKWYYKNAGASKFSYTGSFKGSSYSVTMTDARNGRQVYCEITDAYGNTVRSDTVALRMAVQITAQPKTTYTKRGATATVTVTAAGDGVKYQWYVKNAGASTWVKSSITANTYSVKMSSSTKNRQLYCVVTDQYGKTATTDTVTLRMAATVTTQPKTTYTKRGATATVTVTAAGDGVKYQWYVKNAGASTWVKSSITASTYSVKMASASKDRQVYCVITDKYGNTAETKKVYLRMAVTITRQPVSVTVDSGETAAVSVQTAGDTLTYTWYYKNKGASSFKKTTSFTGNSYSVKMSASRDGRQVYCVITDKYGNKVKTKTVTLSEK